MKGKPMQEYDEKRGFVRMPAHCGITYRTAGSGTYSEGACVNISGSGILFRGNSPLEEGKAAELHLVPENRLTPPLTAYIEVVRCQQGENGCYHIAGSIKGIKSE
jgi:hypothetical protein